MTPASLLVALAVSLGSVAPVPAPVDPATPQCRDKVQTSLLAIPAVHLEQIDFMTQLTASCEKLAQVNLSTMGVAAGPFNLAHITAAAALAPGGIYAGASDANVASSAIASLLTFELICRTVRGLSEGAQLTAADIVTLRALHPDMSGVVATINLLQNGTPGLPRTVFKMPGRSELTGTSTAAPTDPLGAAQSTIINGLARFLLDRAKAETIFYLSKQLEQTLCTDEGKRYFRNFCGAFAGLETHLQLTSMGVYLRSAALRDLQRIPELALADGTCASPTTAEPLAAARLGLAFFREARDGRSPLEIGRNLHRVELECETPATVVFGNEQSGTLSCTKTASALRMGSRLLESVQRQRGWDVMHNTRADNPKWAYFAVSTMLSYEKLSGTTLNVPQFTALFSGVHRASVEAVRIQKLLVQLRDAPPQDDGTNRFTTRDRVALVAQVVRAVTDAASSMGRGTGAMTDAEALLLARVGDVAEVGQRLLEANDPGALAVAASDLTERLSQWVPGMKDKTPPVVLKGLPLVVELANATSSEMVVKTLEAAAAPVGSYRAKYERPSVTLNALLGPAYSYEWLDDVTDQTNGSALSVFAPIGIHASWPICDSFHLGGMVSVLDLGAVVSPRLDSENRAVEGGGEQKVLAEPNVGFAQVLSPGAFLMIGLGKSPIVFGTGFSMVPALRKVSTTELAPDGTAATTIDERNAFRWSAFLAMDLTLLPF